MNVVYIWCVYNVSGHCKVTPLTNEINDTKRSLTFMLRDLRRTKEQKKRQDVMRL